jgi:hypothetical protein
MSENRANVSGTLPTEPSTVEQLSSGVTREWLFDRKIVVYTVLDPRRETVDTWMNAFEADLMSWPADRPFLEIYDLSTPLAALTPYVLARAQKMVFVRPEVKGRCAIILPGHFVNQLVRIFLDRQEKRISNVPRVRKLVANRELAIAWLFS